MKSGQTKLRFILLYSFIFAIALALSASPAAAQDPTEPPVKPLRVFIPAVTNGANASLSTARQAGSVMVIPASGPAGTFVFIAGEGFENSPCGVNIYLDATDGEVLAFAPVRDGAFEVNFELPANTSQGDHTLIAAGLLFGIEFCDGPSGETGQAIFTVTAPQPRLMLDRGEATIGSEVEVNGFDFCEDPACSGVTVSIGGVPLALDLPVGAGGAFSATLTVPGGMPIGETVVVAVQTDAAGAELRAYDWLDVWLRPDVVETPPPVPLAAGPVVSGPDSGVPGFPGGGLMLPAIDFSAIRANLLLSLSLLSAAALLLAWGAYKGSDTRRAITIAALIAAFGLAAALYPQVSRAVAPSMVTDVNPDGLPGEPRFGGRSLGITISPSSNQNAFVASELGGIFQSTNGGSNWAHIDDIPLTIARDVMYDPQDANLVFATGAYDGRFNSQGGIYRSTDGGATWSKPATADPTCTSEPWAWGISVVNDAANHNNVYVGTSCGVAMSVDSGATWTHIDPCDSGDAAFCNNGGTVYDVEAQMVGGNIQVDVCSSEGFFRSTDGGGTWSAPDPNSPALTGLNGSPCHIATAPGDPNTVYLAHFSGLTPPPVQFCISQLVESTTGGTPGSWVDMGVTNSNCRDAWVVSHPGLSGAANEFEVYFGDSKVVQHQTCDLNNTPRCTAGAGNWSAADSGAHSDPSDIAFDTSAPNGCPQILSTDGGISTSNDCGASWVDGNRGLHALDIRGLAGVVDAGHTDLYFGTQDNGMYVSQDGAATWSRPKGADVYNVLSDHTAPARIFYRQCFGCGDGIADDHLANDGGFSDPPGNIPVTARAAQFGPQSYAFITSDNSTPAQWTVWVTTNEGANWTQMGPSPLPGRPGEIKASGPAATPTFYLRLNVNGALRLYSLTGPLNNTATLAPADAGLVTPSGAWSVDPSDPNNLYVSDVGLGQMMVSTNGGASWIPDAELTALVTQNGDFRFSSSSLGSQASAVAYDLNSDTIAVGTRTAGVIVSATGGQSWTPVPGGEALPLMRDFFFDESTGAVYAGTEGRGIWRIDLLFADLSITKSDDPDPVAAGDLLTYTLDVQNAGPDIAYDAVVVDVLPSGVTHVSDSAGCVEFPTGTLTCSLGDIPPAGSAQVEIVVMVDADLVYNNGGPLTITNTAQVSSGTPDPDASNDEASQDTLVVAVADLDIVSFEAVDAPGEVLVGEPVTITLRKEITNHGPSAPIDTELTVDAVAPPGGVVTPTVKSWTELGLGLEELRPITETFTIECLEASNHVFTFTNEIMPLHPADTDPDLSNNTAEVQVQVECVVPVAINIKPGSWPNSINPDNKGVIPIAVLTTAAGEYGLPLAFDATLIDPLSVRFGPPDLVWDESGGAFEAHDRGHPEDSYELDEMTKDGDIDMVLHFRTQETGIDRTTTEACAKGEFVDGNGNVHKFFGCDAVRIVPPE